MTGPAWRTLRRFSSNRLALAGLITLLAVLAAVLAYPALLGVDPNDIDLMSLNAPPDSAHWLGTDGVGRDVLARVLDGGRISLLVATGATSLSLVLGFVVGAACALGGAWTNAAAMRLVDLAMTLPPAVLLLVLASIAGTGIGPTILVIAVLSWPVLARLLRARLMELRERDFVQAAIAGGSAPARIVLRHMLPNTADILVVHATLQFANAVLLEAGLSFLGLGVQPPAASWGNMLNAARSTSVLQSYAWQWLAPGGALVLTALAINFVGDGLRLALDPRATRQ